MKLGENICVDIAEEFCDVLVLPDIHRPPLPEPARGITNAVSHHAMGIEDVVPHVG